MISQPGMNTPLFRGKKDMYRKEDFPSAFMLKLMSKDLELIKAEATNNTYLSAKENGKAKLDMAAIYLELKDRNNM